MSEMSSNPNILGVPKQKGWEKRGNMHERESKTMNTTFWWKFQKKDSSLDTMF